MPGRESFRGLVFEKTVGSKKQTGINWGKLPKKAKDEFRTLNDTDRKTEFGDGNNMWILRHG
jgi:hypothetical protein